MSTHLGLIGIAGFISMGIFRLTDTLLPALAEDFHVSVGSVAMSITAFTLGYGLLQLVYGPLGDRAGKLRIMSAALALTAVLTAACAWAAGVVSLTVLRFLSGMAAGGIVPLSIAHIGDTVPYDNRQATIGHYLAATTMGTFVGGSLAGVFTEYFGWRLAFITFGAVGIAIAVRIGQIALSLPTPTARSTAFAHVTHWQLLQSRTTRIVWGAVFIEGAFVLGAVPYVGGYLRHTFALDYVAIGLVLGSSGLGGLAYSFAVRWLIATFGERGMVLAGGITVCLSYALMIIASSWLYFIPLLALIGIGFFTMHSTLQTRATELAPQARGTALSGFAFCLFLGQGAGVYIISHIVDNVGYKLAFGIASVGVAVLAVWLFRALRNITRQSPAGL